MSKRPFRTYEDFHKRLSEGIVYLMILVGIIYYLTVGVIIYGGYLTLKAIVTSIGAHEVTRSRSIPLIPTPEPSTRPTPQ